jgi:osmotically-inducible protein OsmY
MSRLLYFVLVPFLAGTLLFSAEGKTNPTKTTTTQTKPNVTDAQLEAALHAKLAKSKIGKDGFRFHVSRGVVTWEGNTGVAQHKGAATRMARSSGAAEVVNNIHVEGAGEGKTGTPLRKATVQ